MGSLQCDDGGQVKITLELLKEIAEGHYFSVSDETIREMARELIEWREKHGQG